MVLSIPMNASICYTKCHKVGTDALVCPYFVGVISGHIHASWETFPPFGKAWGDSHRSKEMN
ncbi:hypothetical protein HMPREF0973_01295 [Prevotella veroralis F0319]|uniref:Uncharacterized protein n=1 Tax=Prevotella veroralis F0319 TaxID=649761 RepID=C9MNV7_9BACT|nr:hypothetical protein HMPREF0973_01295 [Prevotella veroralis F0319]